MKVITVGNEKGGVGKTTTAVTLAGWLANRGHSVLLLDTDAQGHATIAAGLEKEPCFYDLLVRNKPWDEVLRVIPPEMFTYANQKETGQFFVVPSNVETRHVSDSIADVRRLRKRLVQLHDIVDIVVIDTAPTPSLLDAVIYMATDFMIYPTKCELWSFDGLQNTIQHVSAASEAQDDLAQTKLRSLMILPTMVRPRTVAHSEGIEQLREIYGNLVSNPLHERTAWVDAAFMGQFVFMYEPTGDAAMEFWPVVEKVESLLVGA